MTPVKTHASRRRFLQESLESNFKKSVTVMVIDDDDEVTMRFYMTILERAGYQALFAKNGSLALALLREALVYPDLILVDCLMREMDGETFLRKLKKELPQVFLESKVVGFTSFDSQSPSFKELKSLAYDCREKAFSIEGFLKIVADYAKAPLAIQFDADTTTKRHNEKRKSR